MSGQRLRAVVKHVTGATRHYVVRADGDAKAGPEQLPPPAFVQIDPADGAFFLLYLNARGESVADTWHETMADAKAQAAFEFGIGEEAWEPVD